MRAQKLHAPPPVSFAISLIIHQLTRVSLSSVSHTSKLIELKGAWEAQFEASWSEVLEPRLAAGVGGNLEDPALTCGSDAVSRWTVSELGQRTPLVSVAEQGGKPRTSGHRCCCHGDVRTEERHS